MSTTLYRKYRPQRFEEMSGQRHVKITLRAEIESGSIAHAYLFVGPRGVGKTTAARLFAKAVNCQMPRAGEPDNRCANCVAVNEGRSLDLIEIDAASHTQVDHVREVILPAARTAPSTGRYKVFIIDEVHMLSLSAFHALLKMLEEPPAHDIFILATTEIHRLPETIISRCQRFDFKRLSVEDMIPRLQKISHHEGRTVESSVLERIAQTADGSLRDAESTLGLLFGLNEKTIRADHADLILPHSDIHAVFEFLETAIRQDVPAALGRIQKLIDDGRNLAFFARGCIAVVRILLLVKFGITTELRLMSEKQRRLTEQLAERTPTPFLRSVLDIFIRREREERFVSIPQLPLEMAVVDIALLGTAAAADPPPTESVKGTSRLIPTEQKTKTAQPKVPGTLTAEVWSKIIHTIGKENTSLALLLKIARPRGIINDVFYLSFPLSAQRDRLNEPSARLLLEKTLSAVLGFPTRLELTVRTVGDRSEDSEVWQQALNVFGNTAAGASD